MEKQFFYRLRASWLSTVTTTVVLEIIIQGSKHGFPTICRLSAQKQAS
ncbi:MAG: hypothetical protein ACYC4D_03320 [Thermoleophilia bacterium]